jgi:hypothetical protein
MRKYTPEQIEFIKENITGRSYAELTELFNARFGTSVNIGIMHTIASKHGLSNGQKEKYTPEQRGFIRENITGRGFAELTELFNKRFGTSHSKERIKAISEYYKFRNGLQWKKYTPEQIGFIRENITGRGFAELTELFNKRFGTSHSIIQIQGVAAYYKFKSGCKPCNPKGFFLTRLRPINAESENNRYVRVKTGSGKNDWINKNRLLWEKANGPLPKGHFVIFADGNSRNFALDNLLLVSSAEIAVMNHLKLIVPDKDLTKSGKVIADMALEIADRERELGIRRIRPKKRKKEKANERGN